MERRMYPIKGRSKAKRLRWGPAQNTISWAYMKMLREGDKTCKVYDVNPYVEVYRLQEDLYGLFNQNNDGMGDVWMYLLIGPEKAMLIDTGCGLGDQKALVDMLTGGKDLIVVNTHLGPDHSFGNCRFSRVYCHQYEVENIKSRVKPGMFDYLFDEQGHNIWLEFDKKDLPAYKPYELVGVPDGYVFHLGQGCDVELIWTAGHAAGHAMYLDKKHGYLFAGDDVCSDVIGCGGGPRPGMFYNQYRNVETYRDCLARLVGRIGEIRYLYPGHFMVHLESHLLLDILEALDAILDDPKNCDSAEETLQNGRPARRMYKFVKGFGTIAYCENGVYRPAKGEADDQKETIR